MSLNRYRRKRDFQRTPEPKGGQRSSPSGRLYVMHKHAARRLHYDLRLELNGTLKSWAIPKGPSLDPGTKRLAIHVEDHPIEYGAFEGVIPPEEYGGGTVMVWDQGLWEPQGDPQTGYERGRLRFRLQGKKLRGAWSLVRLRKDSPAAKDQWLFIKHADQSTSAGADPERFDGLQRSAASGRSMSEINAAADQVWIPEDRAEPAQLDPAALQGARRASQPARFRPQLATPVKAPPRGSNWLHEIKYDGYRLLCFIQGRKVRLFTRNGKDWTSRFPQLARAAAHLPIRDAILDGEAVVVRPDGTTDFQALQNVLRGTGKGSLVYYLFDLPHCRSYDLTRTPLDERKSLLKRLLEHASGQTLLLFSDHIAGQGATVYEHACRLGVEGIVSKRVDSPYRQRRTTAWVKIKCLQQQEFVVGGFTDPKGSRQGFGALLLGYYDDRQRLLYAGRVGTGFARSSLARIYHRLQGLQQDRPPFQQKPVSGREVHWVRPELVAEVAFGNWTEEGLLRQSVFKRLREDLSPSDVRREQPERPIPDARITRSRSSTSRLVQSPSPTRNLPAVSGVPLTNPDRVFYPDSGLTKLDLARFYEKIGDWILPHVAGRPLTLLRCPSGYDQGCFFQKHISESLPSSLRGVTIREKDTEALYIVIDDLPGLITLVQLGALEIHPWGCREDRIERPDRMVFDLDPDPDVELDALAAGARLLRDRLAEIGLRSFLKTSGGKGFHLVVPLMRRADWDRVKAFALGVAQDLAKRYPKQFVATMSKAQRRGRIFIDYLRNNRGATSVAPYSTRARSGCPVSTPLRWDELSSHAEPNAYSVANLPRRLAALKGDPWQEFFQIRQSITAAMQRSLGR
jgi:bifunctional non-homologous end joining protein LigD